MNMVLEWEAVVAVAQAMCEHEASIARANILTLPYAAEPPAGPSGLLTEGNTST